MYFVQSQFYRAKIYGPVYRINFLHFIMIGVYCPEATKVNTALYISD